jgi:hypothetical protein
MSVCAAKSDLYVIVYPAGREQQEMREPRPDGIHYAVKITQNLFAGP